MSATSDAVDALLSEIATFALRYPEVTEGVACAGTAIESRTVRTGKRAFVFLRRKEVRLRVGASAGEIAALADARPDQYELGKFDWVKISLDAGARPAPDQWQRWIDESFRLMATKTRIRKLDAEPVLPPST